jgi:hypothetical protein
MLGHPTKKAYGESMKKAILILVCALVATHYAGNAVAYSDAGTASGWADERVNQSLAEEFIRCSSFNGIAAACAKKSGGEQQEKAAARHEDRAKRFYKGSYHLAGQEFSQKRLHFHDTAMRRNAGSACEGYPKLEQQYLKRCDDTYKRLPRKVQQP